LGFYTNEEYLTIFLELKESLFLFSYLLSKVGKEDCDHPFF
jgi:hypothetical protein